MNLLFVVNVDWFFLSHRLPIALEAKRNGYDVYIAVGITRHLKELQSYGFKVFPLKVERGKLSLISDTIMFFKLLKIFISVKPDLVHLISLKPIVFGGFIAKITKIKSVVYSIPGLGLVFVKQGVVAEIRKIFIKILYKLSFRNKNKKVIFQNLTDKLFLTDFIFLKEKEIINIPGSGVDLNLFYETKLPPMPLVFVMISRLIKEKGVWEFVNAAKLVNTKHPNAEFLLVGKPDEQNPSSLNDNDLLNIKANSPVKLLGQRDDISSILKKCHIVVFPSYYGEGVPKVLLEAAASGRPIITTNISGCVEAVELNKTGFIVRPRDHKELAIKMLEIIEKNINLSEMSYNSRKLAEKKFDLNIVIQKHLEIYNKLTQNKSILNK